MNLWCAHQIEFSDNRVLHELVFVQRLNKRKAWEARHSVSGLELPLLARRKLVFKYKCPIYDSCVVNGPQLIGGLLQKKTRAVQSGLVAGSPQTTILCFYLLFSYQRYISFVLERGAYKIYVLATHGILSAEAPRLIEDSPIDEVVVSNTVPHDMQKLQCHKIKTVDISILLAEAIRRIHNKESMCHLFRNVSFDD